jgi:hypothetical protein
MAFNSAEYSKALDPMTNLVEGCWEFFSSASKKGLKGEGPSSYVKPHDPRGHVMTSEGRTQCVYCHVHHGSLAAV